jgi:acetyltransferase
MAGAQPGFPATRQWPAGDGVTLRPITPDDPEVLQAYIRGLSPESRYNRFFGALQELPPAELEHVTHLDRKYDLALLAEVNIGGLRS